jgi:stage IV sporulation protein FB
MLGNAAPTPYDLRFSLFGIPVRVHPLFWVFSAVMGWAPGNLKLTAIWVGCVFVSILVHELGHALTARYYRSSPEIVLYLFGGYAAFYPIWGRSTARSILILFAGPGAGFLLYAVIHALSLAFNLQGVPPYPYAMWTVGDYVSWTVEQLEFINLWWGLVNLLPVFPLDGGQIASAGLSHWRPYDGEQLALKLSLATAIVVIALAFKFDYTYVAILFASLAFSNFEALQGGGRFR